MSKEPSGSEFSEIRVFREFSDSIPLTPLTSLYHNLLHSTVRRGAVVALT